MHRHCRLLNRFYSHSLQKLNAPAGSIKQYEFWTVTLILSLGWMLRGRDVANRPYQYRSTVQYFEDFLLGRCTLRTVLISSRHHSTRE